MWWFNPLLHLQKWSGCTKWDQPYFIIMNNVYLRLFLMSSGERVTEKVFQWEIICCLKTVPPGYQILGTILKVKVVQLCSTLWPHGLYSPWNSPGQNTGVGSFSLLPGISPTQGSNPGLPYCRRILYQLSHKGRPRILDWVAYCVFSGSSRPRNRTGVSCIAGRFFTNWVMREAPILQLFNL